MEHAPPYGPPYTIQQFYGRRFIAHIKWRVQEYAGMCKKCKM